MPNRDQWESLAEQRIRDAQANGDFASLAGFGKPLPVFDEPYDEFWWVRRKLRSEGLQNSILPDSYCAKAITEGDCPRRSF